jgi:hypothetical protein
MSAAPLRPCRPPAQSLPYSVHMQQLASWWWLVWWVPICCLHRLPASACIRFAKYYVVSSLCITHKNVNADRARGRRRRRCACTCALDPSSHVTLHSQHNDIVVEQAEHSEFPAASAGICSCATCYSFTTCSEFRLHCTTQCRAKPPVQTAEYTVHLWSFISLWAAREMKKEDAASAVHRKKLQQNLGSVWFDA